MDVIWYQSGVILYWYIWIIWYWGTHFVFWALYWRYLILKILTFAIKVLAMDILNQILKTFNIKGFTLYWFSLKTIDIEDRTSILKDLFWVQYKRIKLWYWRGNFNIEGIGPAMYVPRMLHWLSGWWLGTCSVRRGLTRSRNAITIGGLFCFTAVRFSINSSSLAFTGRTYKISQDIVHVFRPDQFRLCVDHKKVATAALVQAGVRSLVDEAWYSIQYLVQLESRGW